MTLIARVRAGIRARAVSGPAPQVAASAGLAALRPARARRVVALALGAGLALAPAALLAQEADVVDNPVLLELYTAQGCASCPPADEMLLELAGRDDVIALALHVDYWDYIGWADTFADHGYTERQQRYARRYGHTTIYTPQVVVNGTDIVEGFRVMQVMDAIAMRRDRTPEARLTLTRTEDGRLEIVAVPTAAAAPQIAMASRRSAVSGMVANSVVGTLTMGGAAREAAAESVEAEAPDDAAAVADSALPASTLPATGPYVLQLVRYRALDTVDILGGENAGRSAQYANIVTSWQPVGGWDMLAPLRLSLPLEGDEAVVVIVQESGQGEIVAAARLR